MTKEPGVTSLEELRQELNGIAVPSPEAVGELAFPVFIHTAPRLPVRPAEQPVHDRAIVESVDVDGRKLAVYRWGDGAPRVLLVHGFGGRASNMAGFVVGLQKAGMAAVSFDFFGHGESEGDRATIIDVEAAMRAVTAEYGPFHAIIAHSFGGLCTYHAVRSGMRVERLVTIASVCDFDYLSEVFCRKLDLDASIKADLRRRSEEFFLPETDIWARFSATYRAGELTVPLLVIHDENDKEIDVEQGRKLSAAYRQARYIETKGLGHRRIVADADIIATVVEFVTN